MFTHAAAGAMGSIVTLILTYPLQMISTSAQLGGRIFEPMPLSRSSILLNFRNIACLYVGIESAVFGIAVTNFVYYYVYESVKNVYSNSQDASSLGYIIASSVSGIVTVLITNPIWVINTRIVANAQDIMTQSQAVGSFSTFCTLHSMMKDAGFSALFAGIKPGLLLITNPVLQYTLFEYLKHVADAKHSPAALIVTLLLGGFTKFVATALTYPLIMITSRAHAIDRENHSLDILSSLRIIFLKEGFLGLYHGFIPKVIQSVLSAALLFLFKELFY
ncbi:putative peroxisomal membrane protein PMP47A, partial [Xylogone sp. PMI_703]